MELEYLLKKINSLRSQIKHSSFERRDLVRMALSFRLDWGFSSNNNVSNDYTPGSTMLLIIEGMAGYDKKVEFNRDALANKKTIDSLLKVFLHSESMNPELLCRLHSLVSENGGHYRKNDVKIHQSKNAEFLFPKPNKIEEEMLDMCQWYNSEINNPDKHPVLVAGEFHHRFVLIHPFDDGNGRIARIVSSLILLKNRIPPPSVKENDRELYLECLKKADAGDFNPWFEFIAEKTLVSMQIVFKK